MSIVSVLALCLGVLVGFGAPTTSNAVQATGDDVAPWSNGWSWTYGTSFRYQAEGTDVTINENVTYTVVGVETYQGHDAYKMNISGNITGGSGSVNVPSVGNATLSNFSGSVSGTRYVRRSDRALLKEQQFQNLNATAKVSIISQGITAQITLNLDPSPSWKTHNFPLNNGDTWQHDETITYDGGFSYDAGSLGGTGADTFAGDLPFDAPATVATEAVTVPIGTVNAKKISAATADGTMSDTIWYSPNHKNDARQVLILPLDGAKLTLTRNLNSANTPAPAVTTTAVATPSLTCAGNTITVAGRLSNFATGVPVSVTLDQSQINPGQNVQATTQTVANGDWSTTLTVPAQSDGLNKNGSRANWGVVVTAGAATQTTTVVVTGQNCSSLAYTGATTAEHGTSAVVKAALTDLTGASAAGRQITFALSGGGSVNATTDANGIATANLPVALPVRGATITASFAGASNLTASQASSSFDVTKISTTTTVAPSESPATIGEPLTFTAHVAGTGQPTGQVQFAVDGADFGGPVNLSGGSATSANLATLGLGNHVVTATYLGSAECAGSNSGPVSFLVRNPLINTTTTLNANPTSSHFGQQVDLTAQVAASDSSAVIGTVTFTSGGTTLGTSSVDANGTATLATDALNAGQHGIVATYSGDDDHRASTSPSRPVTVAKAGVDLTLDTSDNQTVSGEAVNFTATLEAIAPAVGTPNGSVQLRVDGSNVGNPVQLVGGVATFAGIDNLTTGTHNVSAVYAGNGNFEAATGNVQQVVDRAATLTSVLVAPSPSAEGQNVTITANVAAVAPGSGAPTGLVTFTADGDLIGAVPLAAGPGGAQATLALADLAPGSHQILASYVGDSNYAASVSDPRSHTVIAGAAIVPTETVLTSSANPASYGQLVSYTAEVTAEDDTTPAGMVRFTVDGTPIGGQVVLNGDGVAQSVTLAAPAPGDHTVIATFIPDSGYGGSGAFLTQAVDAAQVDLTLTSSDDTSDQGQAVSFTADLGTQQAGIGDPTGFIQFVVDGTPFGDAIEVVDGAAQSAQVSDLAPGTHTVVAIYSGDAQFAPATIQITQTVAKVGTTTTITAAPASSTYGDPVTLTAKVTPGTGGLGSPVGTVSFVQNGTTLATAPVTPGPGNSATASVTLTDLDAGSHAIKAVYSGSAAFEASSSANTTIQVAKRNTTLTADAAAVKVLPLGLPLGQLRATLRSGGQPVAGLPLNFKIGNATICTVNTGANGAATCNGAAQLVLLILNGGYKVQFAGDANHNASNAVGVLIK